jgi:hypothetical protein
VSAGIVPGCFGLGAGRLVILVTFSPGERSIALMDVQDRTEPGASAEMRGEAERIGQAAVARGRRRWGALLLPLLAGLLACGGEAPRVPFARASSPAQLAGESRSDTRAAAAPRAAVREPGQMQAGGMQAMSSMRMGEGDEPDMAAQAPARLDDRDADVREQAVFETELDGGGIERLAALASGDPDARVRRAAVMQLAAADGADVSDALRRALRDSDPGVVEEALIALAASGDEQAARDVRPLLDHPDSAVASLAEETIEALENP